MRRGGIDRQGESRTVRAAVSCGINGNDGNYMVARRQRGVGRVAPATAIVGGNFSQQRAVIVETNSCVGFTGAANDRARLVCDLS